MSEPKAQPPVSVEGKKVLICVEGLSRSTRRAIRGAVSRLGGICSSSIQEKKWIVCTVEGDANGEEEAMLLIAEAELTVRRAVNSAVRLRLTTAAHKSSTPSRSAEESRQGQLEAAYA